MWNIAVAWSGGVVPNAADQTVAFAGSSTSVTVLQNNVTIGDLTKSGNGRFTITGTDTQGTTNYNTQNPPSNFLLTLATTTGTAPTITTGTGRHDINVTIAGSQGFTKTGTGNLLLYGANTYTGTTTIAQGQVRLQLAGQGGLGSTADGTVVLPAGTLVLDQVGGYDMVTTAEPLFISGSGNNNQGSLRVNAGTQQFAGPITATGSANITANPGSTLILSGSINPNGYFLNLGDGGNHTITGGFIGTSGTVNVGSNGAITLSGSSSFTGTTSVGGQTGLVTMTGYMAGPMDFSPGGVRTLVGTGTFAGGLYVGNNATAAPGATQAIEDYGRITSSTLAIQSGKLSMGIQTASIYDQVVMTAGANGLTLGGSANLELDFANLLPNFTTLDLLSFSGLSGNFASVSSTGSYAGAWTNAGGGQYKLENVGTGGLQTLTFNQATGDIVVVPEPSALVLVAGSAVVATLVRLSRRRRVGG